MAYSYVSRPPRRPPSRPNLGLTDRGTNPRPVAPISRPPAPSAPIAPPHPTPRPGPPDFLGQATNEAIAQTDPLLRQITQMFGAQASATQAGIAAATNAYAHNVGGYAQAIPGMFGEARGTIGGVSKGVQALLTNAGKAAAGTESAALAAAGLPAGSAGPDVPLKQEGKGAGAAAGAIGQAMINALQREQQAAMEYAGQLPGFAQARGGQETNMALAQVASAMAQQLAQTTAEVPKLTYQIYNDLLDRYNQDQDRQYSHQQDALALAQRRAGIVGRDAPTNRGREAYWQDVADRRTKTDPHGYVWEGTTSGIRPVRDRQTGRPLVDPAFQAAQQAGVFKSQSTQAQTRERNAQANAANARARASTTNAQTAQQRATTAQQHENNRHAETTRKNTIAAENAKTAQARAAVARRQEAERERHNRASERIARMKKARTKKASSGSDSGL